MRDLLLRGVMAANGLRDWRPLKAQARDPRAAQAATLGRILADNAETTFGRVHDFARAHTPDAFRAATPVHDYEALRPYVEEQRRAGSHELTREAPIFYAQTSGSTGTPKYIPVTRTALGGFKSEQSLFAYLQYRARPEAFSGRAWGIMGAAVEGRLDSGHVVGSVSGHLYEALPRAVKSRFVVPPDVATIADYETKYLVILRLALGVRDVTYLGTPNPSTFLRLLTLLNERRDDLARSLEDGSLSVKEGMSDEVARAIESRLSRDTERARQLRRSQAFTYADLWPRICLLTTWTGGSCGIALEALRRTLPRGCAVMELGYQATELRGTVALEPEVPGGLPPLHHYYFEFVTQAAWDSDRPEFQGLEALEIGERYYVFVTTAAGLYRYAMNDIVEVTGRFERTPLLRFVQKGKGVTSVTGEKLYEAQAIAAMQDVARAHQMLTPFFLFVADELPAGYHLYVEGDSSTRTADGKLAAEVDERLGRLNQEYSSKRGSGRLAPLTMTRLKPGASDAFKAAYVRAGQREGQFKPAVLHYRKDLNLKWQVERYVV